MSERPGRLVKLCGAKRENGTTCRLVAGWGTDHLGEGHCRKHGGNHPAHKAKLERERDTDTEVYSENLEHAKIRTLFQAFRRRSDPTDVLDDLALLRALLIDYVNRHAELQEATLAWYGSFTPEFKRAWAKVAEDIDAALELGAWDEYAELVTRLPNPADYLQRPRKLPDLGEAHKLIATISTLTDRIEKQREMGVVPVTLLLALLKELASVAVTVARESITDPTERAAFIARLSASWQSIQLGRGEGPGGHAGEGAPALHVN